MSARAQLPVRAAVAAAVALSLPLAGSSSPREPGGEDLEGRAPTPTELQP